MLRIHQIRSADAAKSYYGQQSDYYGQELIGDWGGKGAARLGLAGRVTLEDFNRLADNRDPASGEKLTVRQKANRTVGYDFNFNAPKGVSLLYALTKDERVLDVFRSAVRETMSELEEEAATRVRIGGRYEDRQTRNLTWAEFVHFTARPVDHAIDPSLHAHIVAFNQTWDDVEERWKAAKFRALKQDAPFWQAVFHSKLSSGLERVGYQTERRGKDWDVSCVASATVEKFSQRTKQIEQVAAEQGITSPDAKSKLGATTREHKGNQQTWPELTQQWQRRMSDAERHAIASARAKAKTPRPYRATAERESVDHAAAHLFARKSVVGYRELLAEALRHGVGHVSRSGVEREAKKLGLILREERGRMQATSNQVLAEERQLIKTARDGRGTLPRLGRKGGGGRQREGLSADQRQALDKLLASTGFITLFEAPAGTGKTRTATALRAAIAETGRNLVAVAPSARAGRGVLRLEGFEQADTLTKLLTSKQMQEQARGGVILVDEAGMVGVPTMQKLSRLAQDVGARIVLAGDRMQHHAVERGDALRILADEGRLPVARLSENWRQRRTDYRQAVEHFKEGRAQQGLAELDKIGWVEEHAGAALYDRAAEVYCQWRTELRGKGKNPAKELLVVSPTHREADRTTGAIRQRLKHEGALGQERAFTRLVPLHLTEAEKADRQSFAVGDVLQFHKASPGVKAGERLEITSESQSLPIEHPERFSVYRQAALDLAAGDLVRATGNGKSQSGKVPINNGDVFQVKTFTLAGDIKLTNGLVLARDYGHLDYGYLSTSHAAQGSTVDRVLIVGSRLSAPATNRTQAYVSASRGRDAALVLTDDKQALMRASDRDDRRVSASELARRHPSWRQMLQGHILRLRRAAEQERLKMAEVERSREVER